MSRVQRVAGPVALVVASMIAVLLALAYGGGAAAPLLADPGPVVRWGLPVTTLVVNLSAAGMIGALVLVCFALSPGKPEYGAALDVAAGSAAVMTVASALTGVLTYLSVSGQALGFDDKFSAGITTFATTIPIGQAWLATTLVAAITTVLCFAVRGHTALVFVAAFAMLSLLPIAEQGHAADTAGHNQAITGLGLHLVFACVWVGGLITVILLRRAFGPDRLPEVMDRYSTLAIISFVMMAFSGYVNAAIRVDTLAQLLTPYGVLVLIKVVLLVILGFFGLLQRRILLAKLRATGRHAYFWWMVVTELAFMGIAFGVAAALARTPTPVAQTVASSPTPAEILTGNPLPPPETWQRLVFGFNFDPLWFIAVVFGLFFYLAAVWRLHRRGDRWPLGRTLCWVAGVLLLLYITNGGVNMYEDYLFSAHMLAHMTLTMMVPILLVPGAPITLALRAIHKRTDGSRGGREWIMIAVHSWFSKIIANPIVAAVLFAGSLWAFYYTPLFRWAMQDHIGHEWMIAHFLITGYLFVQSLIGIDPAPSRLPYPLRLVVLLGTMGFHAWFGVSLMMGNQLLLANWFGAMGRTWGVLPLLDQQQGGGIAWGIGEFPTLILGVVVAIQWSRSDAKEAKRRDRDADRTGDAELREYNAMLEGMAKGDAR